MKLKRKDIKMLFDLLFSDNRAEALITILLVLPVIAIALTVHEYSHGYTAYKCGDGTAKAFGRLTFNPIKHIDPLGFISMLIAYIGWAKPVPVNMRNLRYPKRDIALVSIAGPASNIILAFISAFIFTILCGVFYRSVGGDFSKAIEISKEHGRVFSSEDYMVYIIRNSGGAFAETQFRILQLFSLSINMNIGLAIFNLIPLPPLDGSKILSVALPQRLSMKYLQTERYASFVILGLIALSWMGGLEYLLYPITFMREKLADLFLSAFHFLY